MLKKFGMKYCKPINTLMITGCKFYKDHKGEYKSTKIQKHD